MRKRMMLLCLAAFYLFITGAGNAHKGAEEESEIILQSESLRECVYEMMEKESGEPLYERELAGCEGSLRAERSFGIESGDDLDFVRRYFDLDTVYSWNIVFPPGKAEGDADGAGSSWRDLDAWREACISVRWKTLYRPACCLILQEPGRWSLMCWM